MKLNKRLTPYPVLIAEDDDYIDSSFECNIEQNIEFRKIKIRYSFQLNNDGIKQLICDKSAYFVIHFECSLLGFREIVQTDKAHGEYEIQLDEISTSIEVSTFIVAAEQIKDYVNDKFNWEYQNMKFNLEKGNVLAIGPTFIIQVDRAESGLKKLTDVICIKEYVDVDRKEYSVVLNSDIIYIYVSREIKNQYYTHGRAYLYNIISMIMVPSMIYILTCMKENQDDLKDYHWFQVIERVLQQNDVDIDQMRDTECTGKKSIFELAQKIFKSPLEKGILELNKGGEN